MPLQTIRLDLLTPSVLQSGRVHRENSMSIIMLADAKHWLACVSYAARATNTSTCAGSERVTSRGSPPPRPLARQGRVTARSGNAARAVLFSHVTPVIGRVYLPIANATTAISKTFTNATCYFIAVLSAPLHCKYTIISSRPWRSAIKI